MEYNEEEILAMLNLIEYYPSRLSYMEAVTMRDDKSAEEITRYGLSLVSHLLANDYQELEKITSKINEASSRKDDSGESLKSMPSRVFAFQKKRSPARKLLNPMDVMTVLLSCCDEFLRQILVEKLVSIKVAFPILLPSIQSNRTKPMILSWSLKSLVLDSSSSKMKHKYLANISNPIISFIRVGNLHRSKSKLLGDWLSKNNTAVFYHRECPNASAKRGPSNGSIEVAWFQSSDNSDENFQFNCNFFTILNLRGNANEFPLQTKLLCESSSLVVIMADSVDSLISFYEKVRNDICWEGFNTVFAIVSERANEYNHELDNFAEACPMTANVVDIITDFNDEKSMTFIEWKASIRQTIRDFMAKHRRENYLTIQNLCEKAKSFGFQLEDDNLKLETNKNIADHFVKSTWEKYMSTIPIFPLQGQQLRTLAELEKTLIRGSPKENESPEDRVKRIRNEIEQVRKEQLTIICGFNEAEQEFYKMLQNAKDDVFMATITLVNQSLDAKCGNVDAIIGMETIVREIAQMYEAVNLKTSPGDNFLASFTQYPQTRNYALRAAELLLMGQPLELLNGDASYIPTRWIKEVFNRLTELTQNRDVFVLSVIGVQSSGKSSLLNALFGLNFPTSAGRCTSGLYCHVLPIDKTTVKSKCDYVLILDAEGFRAPEYAETSTERDNEMATFIVGVSDLTIINIEGENWSEMKDILQIVVYALLRIRQTKHKIEFMPSCVFVHQKISAPDFREKIKPGKATMLEHLNKIVEASAQREGFLYITAFSDVVAYNNEVDSHCLPNMWLGNPPFATISSDYCRAVADLKSGILKRIKNKNECLNFSDLYMRISDLWKAILHENFVFNFRDTKQALAYQSFSSAVSDIEWKFRISNQKKITIVTNKIMSMGTCEELEKNKDTLSKELELAIEENRNGADLALKKTLSNEVHKTTANILRNSFEKMIARLGEQEKKIGKERFEKVCNTQKKKLVNSEKIESKLEQLFTDLIKEPTGIFSNKSSECFDRLWNETFSTEKQFYEDSVKTAKELIDQAIRKYLPRVALQQYNSESTKPEIPEVMETDIVENALKITGKLIDVNEILPTATLSEMCKQLFNKCKEHLESLEDIDFEISQVEPVFQLVTDFFGQSLTKTCEENSSYDSDISSEQSHSHVSSPGSKYKNEFISRYIASIGKHTYDKLCTLKEAFLNKTDAYMHVTNRHKQLIKDAVSRSDKPEFMLALYIAKEVEEAAFKTPSLMVVSKLLDTFYGNKKDFMAKLLTHLAKEEDFSQIFTFSTDFQRFCEAELGSYIRTFLKDDDTRSTITNCLKTDIKVLIKKVQDDITSSFIKCDNKTFLDIDLFRKQLNGKIAFCPPNASLGFSKINKGENKPMVEQEIADQLIADLDMLSEVTGSSILEKLKSCLEKKIMKEISERIASGCCEKCPFCSAPCLETAKDHLTHVKHHSLHYPVGIRGTVTSWLAILHILDGTKTSNNLVLDCCPTLIESRKSYRSDYSTQKYNKWYHKWFSAFGSDSIKYRDYYKEFPNWYIPRLAEMKENDNDYWKWLMAKYAGQFANKYNVMCPKIEDEWHRINRDEAVSRICTLLLDRDKIIV